MSNFPESRFHVDSSGNAEDKIMKLFKGMSREVEQILQSGHASPEEAALAVVQKITKSERDDLVKLSNSFVGMSQIDADEKLGITKDGIHIGHLIFRAAHKILDEDSGSK